MWQATASVYFIIVLLLLKLPQLAPVCTAMLAKRVTDKGLLYECSFCFAITLELLALLWHSQCLTAIA